MPLNGTAEVSKAFESLPYLDNDHLTTEIHLLITE